MFGHELMSGVMVAEPPRHVAAEVRMGPPCVRTAGGYTRFACLFVLNVTTTC